MWRIEKAGTQSRMPGPVDARSLSYGKVIPPDGTDALRSASSGGAIEITARVHYDVTDWLLSVIAVSKVVQGGVGPGRSRCGCELENAAYAMCAVLIGCSVNIARRVHG